MTMTDADRPRLELWLAYYADRSSNVIFTNELAALRYAVDHPTMQVALVLPGIPLEEQAPA